MVDVWTMRDGMERRQVAGRLKRRVMRVKKAMIRTVCGGAMVGGCCIHPTRKWMIYLVLRL